MARGRGHRGALLALAALAHIEAFRGEMDLVVARGYAARISATATASAASPRRFETPVAKIIAAISVSSIQRCMTGARV